MEERESAALEKLIVRCRRGAVVLVLLLGLTCVPAFADIPAPIRLDPPEPETEETNVEPTNNESSTDVEVDGDIEEVDGESADVYSEDTGEGDAEQWSPAEPTPPTGRDANAATVSYVAIGVGTVCVSLGATALILRMNQRAS